MLCNCDSPACHCRKNKTKQLSNLPTEKIVYLLANIIILEAAITRRFVKFCKKRYSRIQNKCFLAASSINFSICGAAIGSIFMYFCIVYK